MAFFVIGVGRLPSARACPIVQADCGAKRQEVGSHMYTDISSRRIGIAHVVFDVLMLGSAMVFTTIALWDSSHLLTAGSVRLGVPVAVGVIGYLGWIGMYGRVRHQRFTAVVYEVSRAVLTGAAGFSLAGFLVAVGGGARRWVVIVSLLWWLCLVVHHGTRAAFFATKRRVIVAGSPRRAAALAESLRSDRRKTYQVVGFAVDDDISRMQDDASRRALGVIEDLPALADLHSIDEVVFSLEGLTGGKFAPLARMLNRQGVDVALTGLGNVAPRRVGISHVEGRPMIEIAPALRSGWRLRVKRLVDIAVATAALVLFMPLMIAVALGIRFVDGVSPIFRQPRVGKDGVLFTIYKFQTMVPGAEELKLDLRNELDGPIFKMESDPRITRLGSFLRKTSIDELPQLVNVLRGEMSLVGPRPFIESEVTSAPESFREREVVTPGMTGRWQVSGRSDADFGELSELDRWYVDNWSLSEDLGILAKTVPAVLRQKGAR